MGVHFNLLQSKMLSLWILSILLLGGSASPLTDQALISDEALEEVVALEEVEEALEEVESRERALEQQLLATLLEEERLLDTEVAGTESGKFIGTNAEGDFTLLSVPFARGSPSVTFNDTTASTLSTVGNAALFLGGLYLLSGFPAAASALADPFGISRRLGVASPTRTARPRAGSPAPRFQHRISKGEEAFLKKTKLDKMKSPRPATLKQKKPSKPSKGFMLPQLKSVNRALGPAMLEKKKQVMERQQRPQLPRFRIPSLPTLRMPQLPRLRRPTFRPIQFNNPFARPSRPRPAPQQAAASPPAARPQNAARPQPATQAAPVFRPSTAAAPQAAPVSPRAPPSTSQRAPVPATPQFNTQQAAPAPQQPQFAPPQQSAPLRLPSPDLGATDFSFSSDPFSEFQSDNFGPDEASFRELINSQFGAEFDSQRLPSRR